MNRSDVDRCCDSQCRAATRRFRALNPHGCIDFIYDSGGYNQYFDMLSAHISYWQSSSFATFVLLQLFSDFDKEEEVPTVVPRLDLAMAKPDSSQDAEDDDDGDGSDEDSDGEEDKKGGLWGLFAAINSPGIM